MATTLIMINPASGDDSAALLDSDGTPIKTVEKGTILKVVSEDTNGYQVAIEPEGENMWQGGNGLKGCIIASPWTYLYTDDTKKFIVSKINKGVVIDILDDNEKGMLKIAGRTIDGNLEGWIDYRYVCREALEPDSEEGDS